MGDVRIIWNNTTGSGDLHMIGPALELGHDLETAVLISLFTDARADPGDVMPDGQRADPRGWWCDAYDQDQIGSKLWQIFWRQTTQETLNWARSECARALQWMIDDRVAASVTVETQFVARSRLGISISIVEPSGKASLFRYAWQQEG